MIALKSIRWVLVGAAIAFVLPLAASVQGTTERITVHGKSLEGNLEGDSPDRDVWVYLPPSYAKQSGRRYPVLYFLHGYTAHAETYWKMMAVPETADQGMSGGALNEMILVLPDAFTVYDATMYSNSPAIGDWEDYISRDLVSYIDKRFATKVLPFFSTNLVDKGGKGK